MKIERKGWEITIVHDKDSYEANCTSSSGQTISSSFYDTENEAIEAGCLLVDRAWEEEHGIKRQVDIDELWVVAADENIALYIDLITGNTLEVLPLEFDQEPDIDPDYLELSDRYLQIPDFNEPRRDMEDFIDRIEDEGKQAIVAKAFYAKGRGGFRRVKDIVGGDWSEFEHERKKERFLQWLESENLEMKSAD